MYCNKCNAEFPDDVRYCKWCGDRLSKRARATTKLGQCPHCSEPVQENWAFCKSCGRRLISTAPHLDLICPHCGSIAEAGDLYCSNCGKDIASSPAKPEQVATAPTTPPERAASAAVASPKTPPDGTEAIFCPVCQEPVVSKTGYCKACGTSLRKAAQITGEGLAAGTKTCGHCESENPSDLTICRTCGSPIDPNALPGQGDRAKPTVANRPDEPLQFATLVDAPAYIAGFDSVSGPIPPSGAEPKSSKPISQPDHSPIDEDNRKTPAEGFLIVSSLAEETPAIGAKPPAETPANSAQRPAGIFEDGVFITGIDTADSTPSSPPSRDLHNPVGLSGFDSAPPAPASITPTPGPIVPPPVIHGPEDETQVLNAFLPPEETGLNPTRPLPPAAQTNVVSAPAGGIGEVAGTTASPPPVESAQPTQVSSAATSTSARAKVITASSEWSELRTSKRPVDTTAGLSPQKPAEPSKGSSKGLLLAVAGVVICCFIAGAGYAVWRVAAARGLIKPAAVPTPTVASPPSPSPAAAEPSVEPSQNPAQLQAETPLDMVPVPAGQYTIGCDDGDEYAKPSHTVNLKAFQIDRTEVTNAQYQKFISATGHPAPPTWQGETFPEGKDKYPVTDVTWQDAADYASWAGKRLPTEAEWEAAARGPDARLYPWGNEFQKGLANIGSTGTMEVGSFPAGASPFGALDMVGNVWEWTANEFELYEGSESKIPDNMKPGTTYRVIRGGAYDVTKPSICSTCYRGYVDESKPYPKTGFRCAKDAEGSPR